ncbi:GNAT family N-acetyltransferase [Candidatus Nitrosotalea bavarica]|uniref:GNAT family N-acetyltransferase n=1 Tax=Candidatus Nitrosotalea bavarica TaxID=1903277 RepID=UPI000C71357F|nr:GNAT family N-acetyltransferase [Candidatus Nitrosotalea bavarica]
MKFSQSDKLKEDKDQILRLTRKIFGDVEISKSDFFDWQYLNNPEGEAIVITAKDDDKQNTIVGVESILPMNILVNQTIVKASLSCNSYVDPDYRNKGIFSKLISMVLEQSMKKNISCIYGVANDNSFNSFVRQGSYEISNMPILFRPLRLSHYFSFPISAVLRIFDNIWKAKKSVNPNVVEFNGHFDESFEILATKASQRIPVIKQRTKEFLNWRYRNSPTRQYKTFVLRKNSVLEGYVITRKTEINGKSVGVIADFMVDSDANPAGIKDLVQIALDDFWKSGVSVTIAISGPLTVEYQLLSSAGFKIAPKFLKPQSAHFILINSDPTRKDLEQLKKYDNWFFSFGDYDVF